MPVLQRVGVHVGDMIVLLVEGDGDDVPAADHGVAEGHLVADLGDVIPGVRVEGGDSRGRAQPVHHRGLGVGAHLHIPGIGFDRLESLVRGGGRAGAEGDAGEGEGGGAADHGRPIGQLRRF